MRVRRLLGGMLVACVLAVGTAHAAPIKKLPKPKKQSALCAAFDPWSAPWVLFGCFIDQPPKDPTT